MSIIARLVLKLLFSATIVALLLYGFEFSDVRNILTRLDPFSLVGSTLIILLLSWPGAMRLVLISQFANVTLSTSLAIRVTLVSFFFNQTLPSTIGGDFARVWYIRDSGASLTQSISVVSIDRITGVLALALLVVVAQTLLLLRVESSTTRLMLLGVVMSIAICVSLLAVGDLALARWKRFRAIQILLSVSKDLRAAIIHPRQIIPNLALALVGHIALSGAAWIIALGLEIPVSPSQVLLIFPTVFLISMIPVSVAGWGVREAAMVLGFSILGMEAQQALALSIVFGISMVFSGIPGGFLWLLHRTKTS